MEYIYLISFLLSIPLIWNILFTLRFEGLFKSGKIWQIRCAYIIVTVIISHFLAEAVYNFVNSIYSLF
jgi:uncharacterized membrane protein YwzB